VNFPDEPLLACFVFIFHVYHQPKGNVNFKYIYIVYKYKWTLKYNVRKQDSHYIGLFYNPTYF